MKCIISCEHASNRVPPRFARLFAGKENVLSSHRGYDPGAADMARMLARLLQAPLHLGTVSRLLVDLNRSPSNRKTLYSPFTRNLEQAERDLLLEKYYTPYRQKVEKEVADVICGGEPVLHLSIHNFSPVRDNRARKADVGLLYDPGRSSEKAICRFLALLLNEEKVLPIRVRKNYPYLGKSDGFTSFLRRKYPASLYAGVEIEMNQALWTLHKNRKRKIVEIIAGGTRAILESGDFSPPEQK